MRSITRHTELLTAGAAFTAENLEKCLGAQEPVAGRIIGAVSNSDTEYRKEQLLAEDPEGIVAGLKAYAVLTGAQGALIIRREAAGADNATDAALLAAAETAGLALQIETGDMVLRTDHREDRHVTLGELYRAAEVLAGEEPGVLLTVEDGPLAEADPQEPVAEILKAFCEAAAADGGEPGEAATPPAGSIKALLTDHMFIPAAEIAALKAADLPARSGVLRIISDADCMVDRAYRELQILRQKSCGRCPFCREGLVQLSGRVGQVIKGQAKGPEMPLAKEIAEAMRISYHCELGEDAPMPVLSLLEKFPDEVQAHIRKKECPAGVCKAYLNYYIDPAVCAGSGVCASVCPADAIEQKAGYTSLVDAFACTRCGACIEACPEGAVRFVAGKVPRNAEQAVRLKRAAAGTASAQDTAPEGNGAAEAAPARERSGKRKRTFAKPVKK